MKLGFIGAGNLASAIVKGVVGAEYILPKEIMIYDINGERVGQLTEELGVCAASSACEVAEKCESIIIAVKPKDFVSLAGEIAEYTKKSNPLIISTAAGTDIAKISSCFGGEAKIVRIMPNINAAVGQAMTAMCASCSVSQEEKDFANELCTCFGKAVWLEEKYFSVFTAIAGSAPAFAFMFADALAMAGVKYGLPAAVSQQIAAQMLLGSAQNLLDSPLAVSELIRNVCSPAGTTIEGVCSLKETGFEASVINAIDKTVEKDRIMINK